MDSVKFKSHVFKEIESTAEYSRECMLKSFKLRDGSDYKFLFEVPGRFIGKHEKNSFIVEKLYGPESFSLCAPLMRLSFEGESDEVKFISALSELFNSEYMIPRLIFCRKKKMIEKVIGDMHTHVKGVDYSDWGKTGDLITIMSNPGIFFAILGVEKAELGLYISDGEKVKKLDYEIVESSAEPRTELIKKSLQSFGQTLDKVIKEFNAFPWLGCGPNITSNKLPKHVFYNPGFTKRLLKNGREGEMSNG